MRRLFVTLVVVCLMGVSARAQRSSDADMSQQDASAAPRYLEFIEFHIKPDKVPQFMQLGQKIVDANRRYKGDHWVMAASVYGPGDTYYVVSHRRSIADAERGNAAFQGALQKAYGAGAGKLYADAMSCVESSHAEMIRVRPEGSANLPANGADVNHMIGESRWVQMNVIYVHAAHGGDYAGQLKMEKEALDKHQNPRIITIAGQSVAGQDGIVFRVSRFGKDLGEFDKAEPPLHILLGDDVSKKFHARNAEWVQKEQTVIMRFVPALSNPLDEIADADPAFWHPKAAAAPAAKPKAPAQKSPTGE